MVKCVPVLPCYRGGLEGGAPQGYSANDMVNYECSIMAYGGFSGVHWVSRGVREVLGGIGEGLGGIEGMPGRFWTGLGGPLENVIFFVL